MVLTPHKNASTPLVASRRYSVLQPSFGLRSLSPYMYRIAETIVHLSFQHPSPANCRLPLATTSDICTTICYLLGSDLRHSTSLKHQPSVGVATWSRLASLCRTRPHSTFPSRHDTSCLQMCSEPTVLSPSQESKFPPSALSPTCIEDPVLSGGALGLLAWMHLLLGERL